MATMTMKLNETEMAEAVGEWLDARGFTVTGEVSLHHDGATFAASADVDRVKRERKKRGGKEDDAAK